MKMRVADYITNKIYEAGAETVFLVTGGMIMHLTDALRNHGKQKFICCHHEQPTTMAADAYGRFTGKLGAAYVTAGPGALNTLTGVVGAFVDSAPMIVVAGQSKVSQATVTSPRQFALQGFNTLPIFARVTKHACMLNDLTRIRYEVEKALWLATTGRPGPVWVEVPIDIQGAQFDPDLYEGFDPVKEFPANDYWRKSLDKVVAAITNAKRPLILAGAGVRCANATADLRAFAEHFNIPVVTSRLGMDLLEFTHPLYVGHPGSYGDRPANFAMQNCDLLLTIGCRMALGLVGHDFESVAPNATRIMVDTDAAELDKPALRPHVPLLADAKEFLKAITPALGSFRFQRAAWIDQTQNWKSQYPVCLPEYRNAPDRINSYLFMDAWSEKAKEDDIFVLDTGSCFHVFAQGFRVKKNQRHIVTGGLSTMGFSPASIGVAAAAHGQDVYCISGDGSIQFNIQEFQTIAHNRLPIKTVVLNNDGYLLIRLTQKNFQAGRMIGESPDSGVSFPSLEKLAAAYNIPFMRIANETEMPSSIDKLIAHKGPLICEVLCPREQLLIPRVASKQLPTGQMASCPYDDMFPFLDREEYERNCFAKNDSLA
jgi:acetolactate synthase-1/2/3 large subunit